MLDIVMGTLFGYIKGCGQNLRAKFYHLFQGRTKLTQACSIGAAAVVRMMMHHLFLQVLQRLIKVYQPNCPLPCTREHRLLALILHGVLEELLPDLHQILVHSLLR